MGPVDDARAPPTPKASRALVSERYPGVTREPCLSCKSHSPPHLLLQESAVIDFLAMEAVRALSPKSLKPALPESAPASTTSTLVEDDRYDSPTATVSYTTSLSDDSTAQEPPIRDGASEEIMTSVRGDSVGTPTLGSLAHLLYAAKSDQCLETPDQLRLSDVSSHNPPPPPQKTPPSPFKPPFFLFHP